MFSQRNRDLHKAILAGNYEKVIQCLDVGPKRERKESTRPGGGDGGYHTELTAAASIWTQAELSRRCSIAAPKSTTRWNWWEDRHCTWRVLKTSVMRRRLLLRAVRILSLVCNGKTAFIRRCSPRAKQGHIDLVRLLLDHGANIKRRGGRVWDISRP